MQAASCSGVLVARLASHVSAACPKVAAGISAQRCLAATALLTSSQGQDQDVATASTVPSLTAEQRRQLPALLAQLRRPGDLAQRLGGLTGLAVSYRDLSVTLEALQMRQHDLDPLVDAYADLASQLRLQDAATDEAASATASTSAPAGAAASAPPPRRGTFLPLKDVTMLPEDLAVDGRSQAPADPQYHLPYMDKISCWAAMQPNHMELSQPLMTGIKLFPPVEAAYPTYVDFDAATRLLAHRTSRKRLKLQRRLLQKQDKYQIKTWDHYVGDA